MMDHIRQRDWNCPRNFNNQFVEERAIDNCVVERIIRNKFWDPMISDDEDAPPASIDWDSIFNHKSAKKTQFRRFVPGFRKPPPYPKLSKLTKDEHWRCMKVLSLQYRNILPNEYVGRPSKADWRLFEEIQEKYVKEQKEYIEWAKHLWTTTNCIRALRPKPLIEVVYGAEYKMKSHMIQCFPKHYRLAAQIPLKAENHSCEITLPKTDLIKVNLSKLPLVAFPNIYESKESIMRACPLPEPCAQHPCKFKLPNETEQSLLPLIDIHKELAQYALDNGADFVSTESGLRCLLETDRTWSLPLSVCEVIGPDGDKSNIIVLGSEFPERKDAAPMRTYRAFKHMLQNAFTSESTRTRKLTDRSDTSHMSLRSQRTTLVIDKKELRGRKPSTDGHGLAATYNSAYKKVAAWWDDDSDDEDRLQIVMDDESQHASENGDENDMTIDTNDTSERSVDLDIQPRKILKARPRLSADRKGLAESPDANTYSPELKKSCDVDSQNSSTENRASINTSNTHESSREVASNESSKMDHSDQSSILKGGLNLEQYKAMAQSDQSSILEEVFNYEHFKCVCKDTEFEEPAARSYKTLLLKNHTTKDQLHVIVHSSHKLRNQYNQEVLLEPLVEYQLDVGGSLHSPHKIQALALALMLRKNAQLVNVRVDGACGEVVTIDTMSLRQFTSEHGDVRADIANTIYTTLNQLAGLLPGVYLLRHNPSHGSNALLYSRSLGAADAECALQAGEDALCPREEARLVHAAPALGPVLLPIHKYRHQLPLTFTYDEAHVAKESNKVNFKKKLPPAALKWPKKRGKKRGKK